MDLETSNLYLIQDSRSYVGNCVLWWGPNRCGYTTDITEAGLYSKEEAEQQHRERATDIPRKHSDVVPLARLSVDMQRLPKVTRKRAAKRRQGE